MKLTKPIVSQPTISFDTKLSQSLLTFPKKVSAGFPREGIAMVEGTINNLPFRAAVNPTSKGIYSLTVNKAMQDTLDIDAEETVTVEITRVGDEPETREPRDLHNALAISPKSLESWADITPMARRDWIFSICTAIQPETRRRRIEKARDMLTTGHRRLCCFPGIKWLMKKNAESCGMWLPLLNSTSR